MLEKIADLQPFILLGLLILLYGVENIRPYLIRPKKRLRHDWRNFLLSLIAFVANGFIGVVVVMAVEQTAEHRWGLLNLFTLSAGLKIAMGVLLMDLGDYTTHTLQHKIPLLWRFHRVHHADPYLNTSSSLRFHPLDAVVAVGISQCLIIVVLGIPMESVIIYGTLNLLLLVPQHSNIKFPNWVEKYVSWVFVTPGWHKIHHSANQVQTDSHYADVFTIWDRIFGTWHKVRPEEIRYGLDEFSEERQHNVWYLLLSPFKKIKKRG